VLEDLGSKNGTRVDGKSGDRHVLTGSHQIECGDVVLQLTMQPKRRAASRSRLAEQASEGWFSRRIVHQVTETGRGTIIADAQEDEGLKHREADLEFLCAFANQMAIAVANARLGARLADEAVARSHLLRFFPPSVANTVMNDPDRLSTIREGEVSVLFCDITDFTAMSSSMDPRQVISLLNRYFPLMVDAVFRHDGTLEKYIGDALLAVWGAPLQGENDALAAVRATVETDYVQFATIGHTTNIASRICGAAKAGEIVIDAVTKERVADCVTWSFAALPPTTVKGQTEALALFRVIA
jgi:adenylate cyclase